MSKKKLILLVSGLLVIAIIGGGVFFYFQSTRSVSGQTKNEASEQGAEGTQQTQKGKIAQDEAERNKKKVSFPLDSFIVNLADPGGRRYLNVKMVLELKDKESVEALEKRVPEIRDQILMILPTKTFNDIQSVEGKNALRRTIMASLDTIVKGGQITNIYFQEFVVQ
ncbi:MAG: flagellar basal body-associated FliL family protein [Deltaproteobacteria bacterium]|nr:flagellar basal body-associated FliL family protein [Deltaproteobacteria bacterium]